MIYLRNNLYLIQHKINTLLYLWQDLDMCLEFIYELVLTLLPCYEDDISYIKKFNIKYECNMLNLNITDVDINCMSSMSSFTNLKRLTLNLIDTRDITFVSSLTNLIEFDIWNIPIIHILSLCQIKNN